MRDESVYLRHILDAIQKIEAYTDGGRKAFFQNTMAQDAVIRNLEIIGEAVRNLSHEFRRRHPEVPWRSITALRVSGSCLVSCIRSCLPANRLHGAVTSPVLPSVYGGGEVKVTGRWRTLERSRRIRLGWRGPQPYGPYFSIASMTRPLHTTSHTALERSPFSSLASFCKKA